MTEPSLLSRTSPLKRSVGRWFQGVYQWAWRQKARTKQLYQKTLPPKEARPAKVSTGQLPLSSYSLCACCLRLSTPSLPLATSELRYGSPSARTVCASTHVGHTGNYPGPSATYDGPNHPEESPPARNTFKNSPLIAGLSINPLRELYFWPTRPAFHGHISQPQGTAARGGVYSDVYCCDIHFRTPSEGLPNKVAVKVLRSVHLDGSNPALQKEQMLHRFQQEGITWFGLLDHQNIVPLIGWTLTPSLAFVSPWYEQGNLLSHLKIISSIRRFQLLIGIAKGLEYLHSHTSPVVHGDLKPENILLSDDGQPLLADFGLSTILGQEGMYSSSHRGGGSLAWMAPECMTGGARSCQSDVYSFGSLAFAVLTGELPYDGLPDYRITLKVCCSHSPGGPIDDWDQYPQLSGPIGHLLRECWSRSPEARPSMSAVVKRLTTLITIIEAETDAQILSPPD